MYAIKPWYASRSIWGGIIAMLSMIIHQFGYTIAPDDQTTIVEMVSAVTGFIGAGMGIWGRIKASKALSVRAAS